ncbi:chloramphenicol acetyltransferase [Psychroserpens burtonensis]|uniref:Chloramphenicol acetyltransferase n=1 Tax=Psychroserpens burtonensis TaxID=49278 RepID=A0A5C7B6W6_9FLAO|nr:CatA-like O-acetyltransferase [Psychroserpens burtonensis]TXE16379.1 chloramphenicol acetyltransferase [Psychroserpens burtonensis]
MEVIDINTWKRKQHYDHFRTLKDPYFGISFPVDVSKAYDFAKTHDVSFFGKYMHDCMKAINDVDELKLRIKDNQVVKYETINVSATLMRSDLTFGFSYIEFDKELDKFLEHIISEKNRIETTGALFPLRNDLECIHCSAMPWVNFSGHKEPISGHEDSIPKLAFSKAVKDFEGRLMMNVSINVNHALVDGYHVGLFAEKFQHYLNK